MIALHAHRNVSFAHILKHHQLHYLKHPALKLPPPSSPILIGHHCQLRFRFPYGARERGDDLAKP